MDREHKGSEKATLGAPWAEPIPGLQKEQGTLEYEELAVRRQEAVGDTQSCLCITVLGIVWGVPRGRSLAPARAKNAGVGWGG